MDSWFIKLHRKIIEWEWYDDKNTTRLFLHLLLTVNFEDKKWRGMDIRRWQIVTGRNKLAEETWLSAQETRTSLDKLKSTNEITITSTKSFSLIQVNNYESYQTNQPKKQPTSNQRATTTKETVSKDTVKELKNTETPPKNFFQTELDRITDPKLQKSLTEWWDYKKGKYTDIWWHKQITLCLGFPPETVIKRVDTAIASGWMWLNLDHIRSNAPEPAKLTLDML